MFFYSIKTRLTLKFHYINHNWCKPNGQNSKMVFSKITSQIFKTNMVKVAIIEVMIMLGHLLNIDVTIWSPQKFQIPLKRVELGFKGT